LREAIAPSATRGKPPFRLIVAGTDGSATAREAVLVAAGIAAGAGAKLALVGAFEPASQTRLRQERRDVPADLAHMVVPSEEIEAALAEAAETADQLGLAAETFAREGDPADAILDVAEEQGADLIVVGNKGMTGARRFLLGSVPNKISHHAPCSVLIVRTT
jgi:nucleotide-binding universal stress UspA family protein